MPDADLTRFEKQLGRTRPGMHLRLAVHESRLAVRQIQKLLAFGAGETDPDLCSWRRAYVAACERASEAIDELWIIHRWPADGARERRYIWTPTPWFRRTGKWTPPPKRIP